MDGKEVEVLSIAHSKTGKHGAAKALITVIDPTTGLKIDKCIPLTESLKLAPQIIPAIFDEPEEKKEQQIQMSYPLKSFDDLVMAQSSSQGFWSNLSIILGFFKTP